MSERIRADDIARYDIRDPDPWLALYLDQTLPLDESAKWALLKSQSSRSRQFVLPFVRPIARICIVLVQILRCLTPNWPNSPRVLHRLMVWGMKRFVSPHANYLILRHFNAASEILAFIADNATPGYRPTLEHLYPKNLDDLRDNVFLKHDLNIYNFIIQLNRELERRGDVIKPRADLDFSAISEEPFAFEGIPEGRMNCIDLHTAIEFYTPLYGLFLTDRDFWRASNSLQLDEIVGGYAAKIIDKEQYLSLIANGHPTVPLSTFEAGFRLMLHGLATEVLHGMLRRMKFEAQSRTRDSDEETPARAR